MQLQRALSITATLPSGFKTRTNADKLKLLRKYHVIWPQILRTNRIRHHLDHFHNIQPVSIQFSAPVSGEDVAVATAGFIIVIIIVNTCDAKHFSLTLILCSVLPQGTTTIQKQCDQFNSYPGTEVVCKKAYKLHCAADFISLRFLYACVMYLQHHQRLISEMLHSLHGQATQSPCVFAMMPNLWWKCGDKPTWVKMGSI